MENGKICTKCGKFQPLSSFYEHKKGKLGKAEECITCTKQRRSAYYIEHRDAIKQRVKTYREQNSDKVKEGLKKYRSKHKRELNEYERAKRKESPVFREIKRTRTELNRIIKRKDKASASFLLPHIGTDAQALWRYLLVTWEEKYGKPWSGEKFHVDHIIPLCTAQTVEEVHTLFRYKNLRLLTPEDNIAKRKNDLTKLPTNSKT